MPLNITADTPRKQRAIAGVLVQVPQPITAETPMSDAFAQMLNQTIAENFSNNLRDRIKEFVPAGSPEGTAPRLASAEEAQVLVDDYAAKYEPGVRTGGGGGRVSLTPVEKEMRNIAQEKLNALLAEQGIKRSQVADYGELVDSIVADHADALRAAAEKIVAARETQSSKAGVDLGGLSIQQKAPAAPAAQGSSGDGGDNAS